MARDFNGSADFIDWGSDASIDDLSPMTISVWLSRDVSGGNHPLFAKRGFANGWILTVDNVTNGLDFEFNWSTARGIWAGSSTLSATTRYHIVVSYDKGAAAGTDPTMYVNGAAETITENSTPTGTANSDAAESANSGKDGSFGFAFLDGRIGWLCFDSGVWDAAARNRARWWGRPHGGVKVYHPLVTAKLANEGSATANGTATGTAVAGFATPVVRPGAAMMGMGVGW